MPARFNPVSARRALVRIRPAAERLCRLYRRLEAERPRHIAPEQPVEPGYFRLVLGVHAALGEIQRTGARVRDLRRGLVEFPARRAGREVLLCWRVGEPSIAHWHEPRPTAVVRRPLDEDGPWE